MKKLGIRIKTSLAITTLTITYIAEIIATITISIRGFLKATQPSVKTDILLTQF